jgi:ankyrin repeat protein
MKAVRSGDAEECIWILNSKKKEKKIDIIHARDRYLGNSSILIASEVGRLNIVEILLSSGANVNDIDKSGYSPLHLACEKGHVDIALLLLSRGAKVNNKNTRGWSPLWMACFNGHVHIVELLLTRGANVNDKNNHGFSVLFAASQNGHLDVVELLLSKGGADVNDKANNGWSSLLIASQNDHINTVELLLYKGANIHEISNDRHTCLTVTSNKDVKYALQMWPVTMAIIMFQELLVYNIIADSLLDILLFLE